MLQSAPCWGDISQNKVAVSQNLVALFTHVWRKERGIFSPSLRHKWRHSCHNSICQRCTFIPHRGFTPESLATAAAVIPGTVVSCLSGRGALCKVATCVPSSDWRLQLAGILHSVSVCSADSYRLKPSVFPKTLWWKCDFLSHLGATALLMPFCPSSKEVWEKRQYFKGCVIRLTVEATQKQCWLSLS